MDCPPKKKMAVVERWPLVEIRLLLITERETLFSPLKSILLRHPLTAKTKTHLVFPYLLM